MDYFEIFDELQKPKKRWFLGGIDFDGEWDFWKHLKPGRVTIPDRVLNISIRKKGIPIDITFADFGLPIVNEKIKDAIGEDDAQYLPVKIPGIDANYYLMIIAIEVECVDELKSVFDKWLVDDPIRPDKAGQYKTIYKLIINPLQVPDQVNIFRLKSYNVDIIISDKLKSVFEKNNVTGINFTKVSD